MNPTSTHLFENIPVSVGDVLATTLSVFAGNWKSLVVLTLAQLGSFFVAAIVLFGITFLTAGAYFAGVMSYLQNNAGYGRHLLDYSTGVSGASRLLAMNGYGQYYSDDDFDMSDLISVEFIITMIFMYVMWIGIISLISSVFQGAFTHTLAEIYAGGTPTASKSIRHGMGKMCSLFIYQMLFLLIITGLILVVGIPTFLLALSNDSDQPNFGVIFLGGLIFVVIFAIISSGLAAAVPSIVVESKTATQAFSRSWSLCKGFICFIFCCQFSFHLSVFVITNVLNAALDHLPTFISFVGHLCVTILSSSITPIIGFVLYMSVRIRTENIVQEDLACEIDSNVPLAQAVEMSTGHGKDSKGVYENVNSNGEVV